MDESCSGKSTSRISDSTQGFAVIFRHRESRPGRTTQGASTSPPHAAAAILWIGRPTRIAGSVTHKRLKRDIGEIAWAIPIVNDVQNNVAIATRRRSRVAGRETEASQGGSVRKHA